MHLRVVLPVAEVAVLTVSAAAAADELSAKEAATEKFVAVAVISVAAETMLLVTVVYYDLAAAWNLVSAVAVVALAVAENLPA